MENKVAILQSFRNFDVPEWVAACQSTVKQYAHTNNWSYKFLGDQLFNFAPPWARDKVKANNLCTISDICRLEWIKSELNYFDIVLWCDIDILILNQSNIKINFSENFGFSYESYFENEKLYSGLNNAFMFFKKNSQLLNTYLQLSYDTLRAAPPEKVIERTIVGPTLLRSLNIPSKNIIQGLDILNLSALLEICNHPLHELPERFNGLGTKMIGGANLCLNERSFFEGDRKHKYDQILFAATNFLMQRYS